MADTNETLRRKVEEQGRKLAEQSELIEKLTQAMEALERRSLGTPAPPSRHQPIDYTANMGLPPSAVLEMVKVVPDGLLQGIVQDHLRRGPVEAGEPAKEVVRGTGYSEPNPLSAPPGIDKVDELCKAQDAQDLAERMRKLGGKV